MTWSPGVRTGSSVWRIDDRGSYGSYLAVSAREEGWGWCVSLAYPGAPGENGVAATEEDAQRDAEAALLRLCERRAQQANDELERVRAALATPRTTR